MIEQPLKTRIINYLLLGLLCIFIPYLITVIIIIITSDREAGMYLFVIPSVIIIHYIFSIWFIKPKKILKYIIPIFTSFISIVSLKYLLPFRIIDTNFDIYGYWDIVLTHYISAIIIWELFLQILNRLR